MPFGLSVALALAAPAAAQPASPTPPTAPALKTAQENCANRAPAADDRSIVICAPKPDGYRIDPDLLAARKAKREALAGRPKPPNKMSDTSCTVVGPAPCMNAPMINILGAVATAAEMAARVSRGQEIGSMFVTDPQTSEYQLYKEAKARREAEALEKAAKAKAKAAAAAAATPSAPPLKPATEGD